MVRQILFLALFGATLFSVAHATTGPLQLGYGAKSNGMGGIGVAFPQDAFVSALNPAGLVWLSNRIDAGLQIVEIHARARVRAGIDASAPLPPPAPPFGNASFDQPMSHTFYWPEVAIGRHLCQELALGIALYCTGGMQTNFHRSVSGFGTSHLRLFYQVYTLTPSLSWKPLPCHSLGVALNIQRGCLSLSGLQDFDSPAVSSAPGSVTDRGIDTAYGVNVRIGWVGHLFPCVTAGISYQSPTWMQRFQRYRGFIADRGRLTLPPQWGFAIAYRPTCKWVISIDLVRNLWTECLMWRNDAFRTGRYGEPHGKGFGWKDQWVSKGGIAFTPAPFITFRAGWSYCDMLFAGPETLINALTITTIQHHATLGMTVNLKWFELTLNYIHGISHPITYFDGIAPNAKETRVKSYCDVFGISLGRCF
jgi:long-chain fatty acid transport protein